MIDAYSGGHCLINSTTSSSSISSHKPSHAKTKNSSSGVRSPSYKCGLLVTYGCEEQSPSERVTARSPMTRPFSVTKPPMDWIRARSSLSVPLWSTDKRIALPARQRVALCAWRERMHVRPSTKQQTTAVQPHHTVYHQHWQSTNALSRTNTIMLWFHNQFPRCTPGT
jgi:hypothetical protein